jgi:hypothetical protein
MYMLIYEETSSFMFDYSARSAVIAPSVSSLGSLGFKFRDCEGSEKYTDWREILLR